MTARGSAESAESAGSAESAESAESAGSAENAENAENAESAGSAETATHNAARLAGLIRSARSVVALTGAGISVPSGIPDFRSPGSGLWTNVDPMEVAHIDVFRRDPERFWHFYGDRFQTLEDKRPNGAHVALAALDAGR